MGLSAAQVTQFHEQGFLIIPGTPGIGIELAPDAREKYPPRPRPTGTRLHLDGSVVDQ